MAKLDFVPLACCATLLIFGSDGRGVVPTVSRETISSQTSTVSKPKKKQKLTFSKCLAPSTLTTTASGAPLGLSSVCASNGAELAVLSNTFEDAQHATAAFTEQIAKAVKIVERGEKLDQSGKIIGERAQVLILLPIPWPGQPDKPIPAVLWTDGPMFREIYAPSLSDILALEKVYK
jgi:hypothetical protein